MDPHQALQQLLQPAALSMTLFPPTSRYRGIEMATLETAGDTTVIYLRRRFVPSPERFARLQEHLVAQGERLDNITARYLAIPNNFGEFVTPITPCGLTA